MGLSVSVLTIASSKGGPGKTTVAMLLAGRLAADGFKIVALAMPTPPGALMQWVEHAYEGPRFAAFAETDETQLAHLTGSRWSASARVSGQGRW